MFATIEEAEQAAKVLRGFTKQPAEARESVTDGFVVSTPEGHFTGWDHLAEHLLAFYAPQGPREDERAKKIAGAKDWVRTARDIHFDLPNERVQALINAVARIVEVLE